MNHGDYSDCCTDHNLPLCPSCMSLFHTPTIIRKATA